MKYFRKGKVIRGPEGGTTYDSINLAKKASREIQLKHGLGSLAKVTKFPKGDK